MNKKILVIFPDHWFAYSPTAVNIFNLLSERFAVQVVALEKESNGCPLCTRIKDSRVNYVKFPRMPKLLWRVFYKAESIYNGLMGRFIKKISIDKIFQAAVLFSACRKIKADEVVGVDAVGFYVAQLLNKKAHFVSLEISTHDIFYQKLLKHVSKIKTVIIQSQERLKLLNLPLEKEQKVFIAQNAPIYNESQDKPSFNGKFIYFGSGNLAMGIRYIFDYFTRYKNYSLMFKGLFDTDLLNRNFPGILGRENIRFDSSFTSNQDIQKYLSDYSVGLCFYDFKYVAESAKQNMLYGPSGKIFNYFAAGLPVIALDIPGFSMVKEHGAGVLLENPAPENIDRAVTQIKADYCNYSENAKNAANDYCFRKALQPFIEYISN